MSLAAIIKMAYENALRDSQSRQGAQAQRVKLGQQAAKSTLSAVDSYISSQTAPLANYASQAFPQATLTGVTSAATPTTALAGSTAPVAGPLVSAAAPAIASTIPASNAAAATGMAATAGGETAAAGAGGTSAGSTAGSALSSTGIGAIVGAGLAIGSSSPGQTLFPAKRFMYNTTLPIYNISGGGLADSILGRFSPRNSLDWVFGNPNEQLEEYRRNQTRAKALMSIQRLSSINDKMQAWGQPGEITNPEDNI